MAQKTNFMHDAVVAGLGLIGVVVSWAYFVPSTLEHGFLESWAAAFTSHPFSQGLHWDLVMSDAAILTIAFVDRKKIGNGALLLTILMGVVFGVCAAIPAYWIARRRAEARSENRRSGVSKSEALEL